MRFYKKEKAPSGKVRIAFALGYDEIELLHAVLLRSLDCFPELKFPTEYRRMKQMGREMRQFLGKARTKTPKTSDNPCPICNRKLRGEDAVKLHLKDVHPDKK